MKPNTFPSLESRFRLSGFSRKLSGLAAACALSGMLIAVSGVQRVDAQAAGAPNPALASANAINCQVTAAVAANNAAVTLTLKALNILAPSLPAFTFPFTATIADTPAASPARTVTGSATTNPLNDICMLPVVTVPIPQATASSAGLGSPTSLSPGLAYSANLLTWTPLPAYLDGGATATASATFPVVLPLGQTASGSSSSSSASH